MFLKETSPYKLIVFLFLSVVFSGCALNLSPSNNQTYTTKQYPSRALVPGQLPVPQSIRSVQLFRKGNPNNPPVLELGSSQKLLLAFDELSDLSGQFRITFTHHNKNWELSNLPTPWYMEGNSEVIVGGGEKNRLSAPVYHHYEQEFPNGDFKFLVSGNYMLHVIDFASGTRLFSLPFFVTEQQGSMSTWVETQYNAGDSYNALERPFGEFEYPSDFMDNPEFYLSFSFTQNRFWGDTRASQNYDFSDSEHVEFHLAEQRAFAANYDFIPLPMESLSANNRKIIGFEPDFTPPRIILREDVLNFSASPTPTYHSTFGTPNSSRNARYAQVIFRYTDGGRFTQNQGVYLVGDFNQWILREQNKLTFNEESGYWETSALIKEGEYRYKYAIKSGNEIDDLTLSDTITRRNQEYTGFVYFRDPDRQYDRLLNIQFFRSNAD